MPDALVGLLFLAVVIGIAYLWTRITGGARKALNRHVIDSAGYRNQQDLIGQEHKASSALPPEEFITAVVKRCNFAKAGEGRVYEAVGRFIETARDERSVTFTYQTGLLKSTIVEVTAAPASSGSNVEMQVHNWIESDGVMIGTAAIQKLWRTIQTVAQESHPTESRPS